jgi:hypothetical protein
VGDVDPPFVVESMDVGELGTILGVEGALVEITCHVAAPESMGACDGNGLRGVPSARPPPSRRNFMHYNHDRSPSRRCLLAWHARSTGLRKLEHGWLKNYMCKATTLEHVPVPCKVLGKMLTK